MQKKKAKQTKKPQGEIERSVNWEAVKMLAMEVGAREAARRLGIKESTVLSRAKREGWNLPKRKGGATIKSATAITMQSTPSEALQSVHADLEEVTKTGLKQTLAKAVRALAEKEALPVESIAQFKDACLAAAKVYGWDGKATVTVNADKAVIVCDEARRNELIAQRQRLLEAKKPVPGRTVDVPTAASQETQSSANVSAANGTVEQDQKPAATQQDPFYRHMQAIGKGESLRTGKGNQQLNEPPVVTDFMPWPEEYQ